MVTIFIYRICFNMHTLPSFLTGTSISITVLKHLTIMYNTWVLCMILWVYCRVSMCNRFYLFRLLFIHPVLLGLDFVQEQQSSFPGTSANR